MSASEGISGLYGAAHGYHRSAEDIVLVYLGGGRFPYAENAGFFYYIKERFALLFRELFGVV